VFWECETGVEKNELAQREEQDRKSAGSEIWVTLPSESLRMSELAMSSPEQTEAIEKANAFKDAGNEYLKLFKYSLAAERYSDAIELHPTAIFYSNRAQALIKLESYGLAIQDANEAIK
jgi:tetratricopeptide (TPR) repeat protein